MQKQYTAEYLNSLPALKRAEEIGKFVDWIVHRIVNAAEHGYTAFRYEESVYQGHFLKGRALTPFDLNPTMLELAIVFQTRFPDSRIDIQDDWVDVRPGVREQKRGILIDWTPPGARQNTATYRGVANSNGIAAIKVVV